MRLVTLAYCRACRGIGTPKTSSIASSKPISKCQFCNSLNLRKAKVDEVEQSPSWFTKPENKQVIFGYK